MFVNPVNAATGNLETQAGRLLPLLIPGAVRVVEALLILIAGIWLSGKSEYLAAKALSRVRHFDQMLRDFFANIVRYAVLIVTGLTVLSEFGIQTTSLVAVIGAASLAIGLALQGTLSNLAAGVMLLIFRPFRLGHHVQVGGNDGTAKELTLFWTEIVTADNTQIIIPNSQVWGQAIKNLSTYEAPPVTVAVRFPVSEAALAAAKTTIEGIVGKTPGVGETPAPVVYADRSPTDNSLQLIVKFAPRTADADAAKSAVIEAVVAALGTPARAG
jgi:small conductance mechanosensitive channel